MIRRAKEGDTEAEQELRQYISSHAQQVNKDLEELEANDMTYFAYKRVMKYLNVDEGATRFSDVVAGVPTELLIDRALEMHTFLSSRTHTVEGNKSAWESQRRGLERLVEAGFNVTTDRMTASKISEAITRAQKTLGNDGLRLQPAERYDIMEKLSTIIEEGRGQGYNITDSELDLILARYMTGERLYNNLVAGVIGQEQIEK